MYKFVSLLFLSWLNTADSVKFINFSLSLVLRLHCWIKAAPWTQFTLHLKYWPQPTYDVLYFGQMLHQKSQYLKCHQSIHVNKAMLVILPVVIWH